MQIVICIVSRIHSYWAGIKSYCPANFKSKAAPVWDNWECTDMNNALYQSYFD